MNADKQFPIAEGSSVWEAEDLATDNTWIQQLGEAQLLELDSALGSRF